MIRSLIVTIAVLVAIVPVAGAETPYDIVSCYSGDVTMLIQSQDLSAFSYDLKGVSRSNIKDGPFDNWSLQIIGFAKIQAGQYTNTYIGKYLSPEGDIIVGEGTATPAGGTWKFIHGTGKWKGITGGGENKTIRAKPIKEGTNQSCALATGKFELPQ